jgi:diphosphomevalonate decarboxylase
MTTATAQSHPNIAFIKYWGNRDAGLRLPANGSISMNLDGLFTQTRVTFEPSLDEDRLTINGKPAGGVTLQRVSAFLDCVRQMSGLWHYARVDSTNNFPLGAGIASSASAFAALSLAASAAAGLKLDLRDLSRLARRGSGSACRSVPYGYVEWQAGEDNETSYAFSIAPPEHWHLTDCIAMISRTHKPTGSTEGHALAVTSPLQQARVEDTPRRLQICRRAIAERDFETLARIIELDCHLMHAVMMTSTPPLLYWQPTTLAVMHAVQRWRADGTPICYTVDAGPNVHVLCPSEAASRVAVQLGQISGVTGVLTALPGGATRLIEA